MKQAFQRLAAGGAALLILTGCGNAVHTSCTSENGSGKVSNGLDRWDIELTKPDGTQVYSSSGTQTLIGGKAIIFKFCATGENPTSLSAERGTLTDYECTSADRSRSAYVRTGLTGNHIGDESGNKALVQQPYNRLVVSAKAYCAREVERSPVAAPL
jgi:hypothetical protein